MQRGAATPRRPSTRRLQTRSTPPSKSAASDDRSAGTPPVRAADGEGLGFRHGGLRPRYCSELVRRTTRRRPSARRHAGHDASQYRSRRTGAGGDGIGSTEPTRKLLGLDLENRSWLLTGKAGLLVLTATKFYVLRLGGFKEKIKETIFEAPRAQMQFTANDLTVGKLRLASLAGHGVSGRSVSSRAADHRQVGHAIEGRPGIQRFPRRTRRSGATSDGNQPDSVTSPPWFEQ